MSIEVRVPTLGESVTEATVATWFKKPGEAVAADEMLCELETDKVTVEVPAPAAGTLGEIVAAEGETVGVDALLATLSEGAGAAPGAAPAKATEAPAESGGGESVDVMVPTLGESVTEATVATWFKKPGDTVTQDEMLCELETDKVSVEVPAPPPARLSQILAEEGSDRRGGRQARRDRWQRSAAARPRPGRGPGPGGRGQRRRQGCRQRAFGGKADGGEGPRPASVQGTGRDGRIMKEDVLRAARPRRLRRPPAAPRPPPSPACAGRRRGCRARGAGEDDPPAPDHRQGA
jgi:2-oxoglutarate dehydrogenase E2 component (dihydrolipoamide succinyltransferase)